MVRRRLLPLPQLAWYLGRNRRRRGDLFPGHPVDPDPDPELPVAVPYASEFILINASLSQSEVINPMTSDTHLFNS